MSDSKKVELSDEEQWNEFRFGNTQAFEGIYNKYIKLMLSYGRKIVNDRQLVADSTHEIFANLWARREHINPTTSVKFYLLKAVRNALVKEARKGTKHTGIEDAKNFSPISLSHESFIVNEEINQERQALVKEAMGLLSNREQEILYLKYFGGLSNEEISELLSIQYQSVKNTSFSAIKKLRKYFSRNQMQVLFLAFHFGAF